MRTAGPLPLLDRGSMLTLFQTQGIQRENFVELFITSLSLCVLQMYLSNHGHWHYRVGGTGSAAVKPAEFRNTRSSRVGSNFNSLSPDSRLTFGLKSRN